MPAGDVDALTEAARELLDDPQALEQARAGADRARQELTWKLPRRRTVLYKELLRTRFSDVIGRQLELFQREQAALIEDCDTAELKYDQAGRDDAEEKYADYLDLVETGTKELAACETTSPRPWTRSRPRSTKPSSTAPWPCAYRASRWRSKHQQGLVAAAATVSAATAAVEAAAAEVPTAAGVGAAATHVVAAPAVIGRGIVVVFAGFVRSDSAGKKTDLQADRRVRLFAAATKPSTEDAHDKRSYLWPK